jgi:hypothetical protein
VLCLALIIWQAEQASPLWWALWCVCTSVVSLSQPALGQAFPAALAGRALSAFNLMIFAGVFALQWGIGLAIDALRARGVALVPAYQVALSAYWLSCVLSYLWLVGWRRQARQRAVLPPAH